MAQIHTHYDNLKVARNAPPEIIRAAYKTLSQKYHPDRNPGNPEAARIMAIINTSYDVLSDPDRRREHDLWIERQEKEIAQSSKSDNQSCQTSQTSQAPQQPLSKSSSDGVFAHVLRNWLFYGIVAFFVWIWVANKSSITPISTKPYQANPTPVIEWGASIPPLEEHKPYQANPTPVWPKYVRPTTAPNGNPWPTSAGYIKGYQRLHANGRSTVTVDNSRNDSDVFVKLVSLDRVQAYPVRQFYIPAFSRFVLNNVTAGSYDIRYRDLNNGALSRSEAFVLEEIPTYSGIQYSNITMTLYKVENGNMQTYELSEAEF